MVKNPNSTKGKADIYYYDIGDYLARDEKLKIIESFGSTANIHWQLLAPNEHGDWINHRNKEFDNFIGLTSEDNASGFFDIVSWGVKTNRDAWVYASSNLELFEKMKVIISTYNSQLKKAKADNLTTIDQLTKYLNHDPALISWSANLKQNILRGVTAQFNTAHAMTTLYRPYFKQKIYFDKLFIERPGQNPKLFPYNKQNVTIVVNGVGSSKEFSALISKEMPDIQTLMNGQSFPLYYYEKVENDTPSLFDNEATEEYIRHDGISDFILKRAKEHYIDGRIEKEDIFYYVYGLLHSTEYRRKFANDLKKMLPRIPLVDKLEDFWAFSQAGHKLAELHVKYEDVPAYEGVKVSGTQHNNYHVEKLKFVKKGQRDTILYNSAIKIENIPEKAYEYIVNGKSAIEWIMERYQITTNKDSGIVNDPNDWSKEVGNPRYILDLILSVINVSVQTVDIVNALPKLSFKEDQ